MTCEYVFATIAARRGRGAVVVASALRAAGAGAPRRGHRPWRRFWDDRRFCRLKLLLVAVLYLCAAVVGRGS